jgi:hypothetical protein
LIMDTGLFDAIGFSSPPSQTTGSWFLGMVMGYY